jgi:hypothetical protein
MSFVLIRSGEISASAGSLVIATNAASGDLITVCRKMSISGPASAARAIGTRGIAAISDTSTRIANIVVCFKFFHSPFSFISETK